MTRYMMTCSLSIAVFPIQADSDKNNLQSAQLLIGREVVPGWMDGCRASYCCLPNFGRSRQEQLCRTDARQPSIRPDTTSQPIRSCADCRLFLSGSARIGKTAISAQLFLSASAKIGRLQYSAFSLLCFSQTLDLGASASVAKSLFHWLRGRFMMLKRMLRIQFL